MTLNASEREWFALQERKADGDWEDVMSLAAWHDPAGRAQALAVFRESEDGPPGAEYRMVRRTESVLADDSGPKAAPAVPGCRGFQWIGQSFATCDGCGKPAWEHEGEARLRAGASLFGDEDDWELRPWKPGEAEAIKRKWAPR